MRPKAPKHRKNKRRLIDEGHLRMIRQLPCILSGLPAEAAHISYGDLEHDKPHNAMGIRADDKYVLPLAPELHRLAAGSQHNHNEREWWEQFGIDPVQIALRLWRVGRNHEAQMRIVNEIELSAEARARVEAILRGEKT
jgi:hypothetical protein